MMEIMNQILFNTIHVWLCFHHKQLKSTAKVCRDKFQRKAVFIRNKLNHLKQDDNQRYSRRQSKENAEAAQELVNN